MRRMFPTIPGGLIGWRNPLQRKITHLISLGQVKKNVIFMKTKLSGN
jgi:hypothetical protein